MRFAIQLGTAVVGIVAGAMALAEDTKSSAPTATRTASSIKAWRKPAVERKRRILFNNDGGAVKQVTRPTAQAILDDDTTPLVGSQVDTILYCTQSSGFGLFTHFTKIGQILTSREDIFANNQMAALIQAGIDPLQVMVDFGKQHGIEVFWSMRMNDTHDGSKQSYGPVLFRANKLKVEHPEYLIGTPENRPKHGAWTAVDYARPEIRELAFRFFEEVCRNYDVDGIELDFSRHPVFFKSTSRGKPATDEERTSMTDLMRRIRTMADEVGQKRGRPILIAMRVPDSVEYGRAIGLDIEHWLANDLLDLFVVASYFQINDWDYSVALARKYGVNIYPSLDESRVREASAKQLRTTNLAYRGRAANVWAAGADGVYLFNFVDPVSPVWSELYQLGDPKKLAKLDKDYFGSIRGASTSAGGNLPYEEFQNTETLNPGDPKIIAPGKKATARIHVAETNEQLRAAKLKLRLQFREAPALERLSVRLNGIVLRPLSVQDQWLECSNIAGALHKGANNVEVTWSSHENKQMKWNDLMLEVRHLEGIQHDR